MCIGFKENFVYLVFSFSRHYKQAYGHILEQRMHDTNMLEIKTIAGFVNYKVNFILFLFWSMLFENASAC